MDGGSSSVGSSGRPLLQCLAPQCGDLSALLCFNDAAQGSLEVTRAGRAGNGLAAVAAVAASYCTYL